MEGRGVSGAGSLQSAANCGIVLVNKETVSMLPIFMTIDDPEDRDLFAWLYEEHASFLVGTALRILEDRTEAEDAVQDVFVKLMDSPERLRRIPEEERIMFLVVCTRNRARDILRKKNRILELELNEDSAETAMAPDEDEPDLVTRLKEEMAKLPLYQQEILEMHYFWGMKFDEIGKQINKKPATVQKMAHRLTKKLKKRLEGGAK